MNPEDPPIEAVEEESPLRPSRFDDFQGQTAVMRPLSVYVEAALERESALDHVLLTGPPGLGKTTIARMLAQELGVDYKATSGPLFERPGDIAAILTRMQDRSVLFIDEIHRIGRPVEELLYGAMEDFHVDVIAGSGPAATSIRLSLPPFTLVAATTLPGRLAAPFRDRFGIVSHLSFYNDADLAQIVARSAGILRVDITDEAALIIAQRSRGTPRIANARLRRVCDFALVAREQQLHADIVKHALAEMAVDPLGLEDLDRRYLNVLSEARSGQPVGVGALAAALNEEAATLEELVEPFLLSRGLITRTARGRMITPAARSHIGVERGPQTQMSLPLKSSH